MPVSYTHLDVYKRQALEKATEADLAQLDSGLMPEAMDKYYGLRYPSPATLLDNLDTPLFILDEVDGIRDAQKATELRRSEELTGLLEEGVLCPGLDVLYQTMDDLAAAAQKRLSAIREFTAFGSGFRIAMRDLQIRGAGSLLGHSQHGHIDVYKRQL